MEGRTSVRRHSYRPFRLERLPAHHHDAYNSYVAHHPASSTFLSQGVAHTRKWLGGDIRIGEGEPYDLALVFELAGLTMSVYSNAIEQRSVS